MKKMISVTKDGKILGEREVLPRLDKEQKKSKKKYVKLTNIQRAIIDLAEFIEAIPGNEYNVRKSILDTLGLEFEPNK